MMLLSPILIGAAILPVVALGIFIYLMDKNKEPKGLLFLMFFMGIVIIIPVLIGEVVFSIFFPMEEVQSSFFLLFLNVFFGVAFFEEIFKWLATRFIGYNNREFDEVYDIIIYAVFTSLGFACLENILYVLQNGFSTAILRAIFSIPGHTCFGIMMGYYLSKAKVADVSGNKGLRYKYMFCSTVVPMLLHTLFDSLLFFTSYASISFVIFLIFYVMMVTVCFIIVFKTSKVQQNLTRQLKNSTIGLNQQGYLSYQPVQGSGAGNALYPQYCPICGRPTTGANFCARCGFRLK